MTTQLPATFVEAAARSCAMDRIKQDREQPFGMFHPDAERLFGKQLMKHVAQFHPLFADDIAYFAENGNKQADLALQEMIAEHEDRGEPLTAVLAAYSIRQRNPLRKRKTPGPKKADQGQFVRDIGIVLLVEELVRKFNLSPHLKTSSLSPHKTSSAGDFEYKTGRITACSIVAEAVRDAGIGIMTAKNVERIWRRYFPIASGKFPVGYIGLFDQPY